MKNPFKSTKNLKEEEFENLYQKCPKPKNRDNTYETIRFVRKELETTYGGLRENPVFLKWSKKKVRLN